MQENIQNSESSLVELNIRIYNAIRDGNLSGAEELTLKGMEDDFKNAEYEKLLKIIKFWQNRKDLFQYHENNGEKLLQEWDNFISFCKENQIDKKKAVISAKDFVFRKAVDLLIDSYRLSPVPERETLILLGQSFYEIGMIDKAAETLEYAMSISTDEEDVRIYSMLGNLYSEMGEKDLAMIMINEAFLKFPQLISLDELEFPPAKKLREMIRNDGFHENEEAEWMPVYGYLYEGLTVKRKLEYKDYMDLKEKIIDYEKSLKIDKRVIHIIIPRLINYYLWIFDYYNYQANAAGPAKKIAERVLELIGLFPGPEEVTKKLSDRASILLKSLIESKAEQNTAATQENQVQKEKE